MPIDTKDREILRVLQADCRISNADLAERIGISASSCWRRVRALEEAGVIRAHVAVLDARRAEFGFSAVVHVSLSRHDRNHVDTFVERIRLRPEVVECFATTGDADYHLRVVTRDADAYNDFLDEFLFGLPGLSRIRTNMVLKEIKHTTRLPV